MSVKLIQIGHTHRMLNWNDRICNQIQHNDQKQNVQQNGQEQEYIYRLQFCIQSVQVDFKWCTSQYFMCYFKN